MSSTELFDVQGLVAVITGGGTGLGLMMAKALESHGATVYIIGRRLEVLEQAAKDHAKHGHLIPAQGDVTVSADMDRIVAEVESRHGAINLLINNAGIARSVLPRTLELGPSDREEAPSSGPHPGIRRLQKQLAAGGPADFAEVFEANVTASYYLSLAFLPLLEAGNRSEYARTRDVSSQIIFISSVHGRRNDREISSIPYTMSKSALEHISQILASMLGQWKIRSNTILPGLFPSEMTAPFMDGLPWQEQMPSGRMGDSKDVAGLILFLASRAGAYVNGAAHVIDGGWLDTSLRMSALLRVPDS